jgi:hypothetical protein
MGWSFSFLAAGFVNKKLAGTGLPLPARRGAYLAILWLGVLLIWGVILQQQT